MNSYTSSRESNIKDKRLHFFTDFLSITVMILVTGFLIYHKETAPMGLSSIYDNLILCPHDEVKE